LITDAEEGDQIMQDKMDRSCNMYGRGQKCIKNFSGKPEGKKTIWKNRCRWKNNIRMDLREIWWEVVDWIHLAQDRNQWWVLVNMVTNLQDL
jgi:hypothetical protein